MGFYRVALLLLTTSFALSLPTQDKFSYGIKELGVSCRKFAGDLYTELAQKNKGNILVSPASLHTLLSLIQMAADGQTLNEMHRVLYTPIDKSQVKHAFKELIPVIKAVKHATLSSANKIYINEGFDLNPNYTAVAKNAFSAEVEQMNFLANISKNVKDINAWVEQNTNKKIKNLVQEDYFTSDLEMILINALYFKGEWEVPFDPELTHKRRFYYNETDFVLTDMMLAEYTGEYFENKELDCKFLNLPYSHEEFVMTFVLPNKRSGLPELEGKMALVLEPQNYSEEEVIVTIPKFKIRNTFDLKDNLVTLGMDEAFRDEADLSDFTISRRNLKISKVIQKTFIDVNEKGTEAAAASAGFNDRISGNSTGKMFDANHPFLFILRLNTDGKNILFTGRYSFPEEYTEGSNL